MTVTTSCCGRGGILPHTVVEENDTHYQLLDVMVLIVYVLCIELYNAVISDTTPGPPLNCFFEIVLRSRMG